MQEPKSLQVSEPSAQAHAFTVVPDMEHIRSVLRQSSDRKHLPVGMVMELPMLVTGVPPSTPSMEQSPRGLVTLALPTAAVILQLAPRSFAHSCRAEQRSPWVNHL